MKPRYVDATVTLYAGDCLDVLAELPDASVDAVVTDPPYGLEFMGKEWDAPWKQGADVHAKARDLRADEMGNESKRPFIAAGVNKFVAGLPFQQWCELWTAECLRVLKPGGHLIAAGGSRTFHRLVCAVENAGFEIRDCITWHFGSGFPKSRNVTKDLQSLPACTCDVSGQLGTVDAGLPASLVGARVRAEAGSVPLAGGATHLASGVGPEVVATGATDDGLSDVDALDIHSVRHASPVVLGTASMTPPAQSQEVVEGVGRVEVNPESLRDEVVREEVVHGPAVPTGSIPSDDGGRDGGPLPALVPPLSSAPSRVAFADEAGAVSDGHARASAVDAAVGPVAELDTADGTDVDPVSLASHGSQSTAEMPHGCEVCGGLVGEIPAGLGTALKPATEFFTVARKPLTGTVAANVLAHGTGALNIDGCRIEHVTINGGNLADNPHLRGGTHRETSIGGGGIYGGAHPSDGTHTAPAGRWPANVCLDQHQADALDQQSGESRDTAHDRGVGDRLGYGGGKGSTSITNGHTDAGGASRFFYVAERDFDCCTEKGESCSENAATGAATTSPATTNGNDASRTAAPVDGMTTRFQYIPKADASERVTIDGTAHPTVKPLALMRWLVRLVTPPGGTVLEPFAGSGTTVEACILEGFRCIAIEREADYLPLITQRINRRRDPVAAVRAAEDDGGLFDLLDGGAA